MAQVRCTTFEEVDKIIEFRKKITNCGAVDIKKFYYCIVQCGSVIMDPINNEWYAGNDTKITSESDIISYEQWLGKEECLNRSKKDINQLSKETQAQIILFEGQCKLQAMLANNEQGKEDEENGLYESDDFYKLHEEIQKRIKEL